MEQRIFPRPAVAEVLRDGFIESRLHMDAVAVPEQFVELQAKHSGTVATPTYVVIDPATGKKLAFHQLTTVISEDVVEEGILGFLRESQQAASR